MVQRKQILPWPSRATNWRDRHLRCLDTGTHPPNRRAPKPSKWPHGAVDEEDIGDNLTVTAGAAGAAGGAHDHARAITQDEANGFIICPSVCRAVPKQASEGAGTEPGELSPGPLRRRQLAGKSRRLLRSPSTSRYTSECMRQCH